MGLFFCKKIWWTLQVNFEVDFTDLFDFQISSKLGHQGQTVTTPPKQQTLPLFCLGGVRYSCLEQRAKITLCSSPSGHHCTWALAISEYLVWQSRIVLLFSFYRWWNQEENVLWQKHVWGRKVSLSISQFAHMFQKISNLAAHTNILI